MGEPDEHTAAVSLSTAHATECLRNPLQWTGLQRTTPDNMDPATQLKLGGTREGHTKESLGGPGGDLV